MKKQEEKVQISRDFACSRVAVSPRNVETPKKIGNLWYNQVARQDLLRHGTKEKEGREKTPQDGAKQPLPRTSEKPRESR